MSESSSAPLAVVTGGSRGIGRATVLALAGAGIDSIFTYHARKDAAQEVEQLVREHGGRATALELDVTDIASFGSFAERVRESLAARGERHFYALVNNAGTSLAKSFEETAPADIDAIFNAHFKSAFFLTQRLLPMIADGGRIINISSGLTRFTFPGRVGYACAKAAVETLTLYLAAELGSRGITVNTVAPGAIATDFSGGVVRDNPEVNRHVASVTALGRVGLPEDIGPMIASLLSPANRWVTGQRIEVSGGMHL